MFKTAIKKTILVLLILMSLPNADQDPKSFYRKDSSTNKTLSSINSYLLVRLNR